MEPLTLTIRNVNGALPYVLEHLNNPCCRSIAPRGASTFEWPTPVLTIYQRPRERVLFLAARDANPFFHLFESLWMLAGRQDVEFVAGMVKRMRDFSDDGKVIPGAYGYRWRRAFGRDQIQGVVELLREDPSTRRAVVAMWSPSRDGDQDVVKATRDLPCNTHVYFKVRDAELRMTVCCRSNDVLWGAYGANAVHFSMLQEYVAQKVGVKVGAMFQLSDSWHVYTGGAGGELWARLQEVPAHVLAQDPYESGRVWSVALGAQDPAWDADLKCFFALYDAEAGGHVEAKDFLTPWWREVAVPMWRAWRFRRASELADCRAGDWQLAGLQWLARRSVGVTR